VIRRITLQHWRAYDHLDLPLTHPVTFLVAPNGVGKSSLVEAVRWALLGTPADRNRGRAVRGGHDRATVSIALSLPGHDDIQVTRTLRRSGASTFDATVDGHAVTEDDYATLLAHAWSAEPPLLDSIIFGPSIGARTTGFPIRDHLAAVFRIEPLLRAAADIKTRRDLITAQIRLLRDDASATADAIASARTAVSELQGVAETAEADRAVVEDQIRDLELSATQALAWEQYRDRAAEARIRTQTLMNEMAANLAEPPGGWGTDPRAALTASRDRASETVDAALSAAAQTDVAEARSASAAEVLATATDVCPTCLRPLTPAERDTALAAHGDNRGEAHESRQHFAQQTAAARAQLAAITRFSDALARLQPPVEPDHPDPGPTAHAELNDTRLRAGELAQIHGQLLERLGAAQGHLAELEASAKDQHTLARLGTQDLTLEVTQRSIAAVTNRLLTERVEPLATEIAHRWKLLFGSDGLQLDVDGQLHLGRPDIDLALTDFSGGERATALLITRIMLVASATQASTLWLDEPLEHLDPTRRASVAQTLVRAAQAGTIDQMVVTTYEEGLARRLQATAPDTVELTYVRSTANPDLD
jgi:DNA repair exonuclease SbcCD ATPase subunit